MTRFSLKHFWNKEKTTLDPVSLLVLYVPFTLLGLLVVLVLLSAFAVTYSAYEYRRLFNQLQIMQMEADRYHTEWSQLLIEEASFGAPHFVEKRARETLSLVTPSINDIRWVSDE